MHEISVIASVHDQQHLLHCHNQDNDERGNELSGTPEEATKIQQTPQNLLGVFAARIWSARRYSLSERYFQDGTSYHA